MLTMEQWKVQMREYETRRDAAMDEAGVTIGDRVEYHLVSPWGTAEILQGALYLAKNEQPKVRVMVPNRRPSPGIRAGARLTNRITPRRYDDD